MTNPTADAAKLLPSRMKMADVKVGDHLVSTIAGGPAFSPITITEITERGFRYKLDAPVCLHPLMGTTEGGEHFGYNGECFYERYESTGQAMHEARTALARAKELGDG